MIARRACIVALLAFCPVGLHRCAEDAGGDAQADAPMAGGALSDAAGAQPDSAAEGGDAIGAAADVTVDASPSLADSSADSSAEGDPGEPSPAATPSHCNPTTFPLSSLPLPEASGATFAKVGNKRLVYVTSDSGHDGDAVRFDVESGAVLPLKLPLQGPAGDDLEGLSMGPGGVLYGLTSSGWMREWTLKPNGAVTTHRAAYPLGEPGSDLLCDDGTRSNCAANFEGLCLHPSPEGGGCVGYAASKELGVLICLVEGPDGALLFGSGSDDERDIEIANSKSISGCHFMLSPPYALLVVTNDSAGSRLLRVDGPGLPPVDMGVIGGPSPEAVAVDDEDRSIIFSDLANQSEQSEVRAFSCDQ